MAADGGGGGGDSGGSGGSGGGDCGDCGDGESVRFLRLAPPLIPHFFCSSSSFAQLCIVNTVDTPITIFFSHACALKKLALVLEGKMFCLDKRRNRLHDDAQY